MKNEDKSSVEYLAPEMAKLYKALGPSVVSILRSGSRVDHFTQQLELDPVYINEAGLRWLHAAESLIAQPERSSVGLEDLTLAFEATYDPTEKGWCTRGAMSIFWNSTPIAQGKAFRNDFA